MLVLLSYCYKFLQWEKDRTPGSLSPSVQGHEEKESKLENKSQEEKRLSDKTSAKLPSLVQADEEQQNIFRTLLNLLGLQAVLEPEQL